MFKFNRQIPNSQRGFSLVEILIGVAMLGGLSVAVINMTKQQAKLSTQSQIDGDISEISARILNALNSPELCQTNFHDPMPTGTHALTSLVVSGTTILPQVGPGWSHTATAGNITDRVRMNSAIYSVQDSNPPVGTPRSLASLSLTVAFETTALENKRKNITKTFSATVIVNKTAKIVGCPKSWNSTLRYLE
jgi:prepilin-type N-terminal cleavage/methylation domain-containing protein